MNNFLRSLRELRQYPSAVAGGAMIIALVVIAIYTIIAIPYAEAVHLWRGGQESIDRTAHMDEFFQAR